MAREPRGDCHEQHHAEHERHQQKREQRFGENQEIEEDERRIKPADACRPRADPGVEHARSQDIDQRGGGQAQKDLEHSHRLKVVGADRPNPREHNRVQRRSQRGWLAVAPGEPAPGRETLRNHAIVLLIGDWCPEVVRVVQDADSQQRADHQRQHEATPITQHACLSSAACARRPRRQSAWTDRF